MPRSKSPRVLYLEDDEEMAYYVPLLLGASGCEVVVARNLIEGLRLAKSKSFDLYLLDYSLPGGTGIELCRLIRIFDASTPILFYSSTTDEAVKQSAISAGAQRFISKSEPIEDLIIIMGQAIADEEGMNVSGSESHEVSSEYTSQRKLDRLVRRYNADYLFLLTRAGKGQYDCLLTAFFVLKDLYNAVMKLHEVSRLEFRVTPYSITPPASDELLTELGFARENIENIKGFLRSVQETQGREFDDLLEEELPILCGGFPSQT